MKAATIGLAVLVSIVFGAALPACAGELLQGYPGTTSWDDGYYDTAWGMPLAVLVPPNARWQTNYSWGVGGTRIAPIGSHFRYEYPGPESAYRQGSYLPAPSQPSDTRQMGDYYVRGPRQWGILHGVR